MSMTGIYTPPDYVPPTQDTGAWRGPERRSHDPVDRLSRSLNQLCLEATDHYEIVAHLEALGLNSPQALARLGETDHFEMAQKLFERTPKRFFAQDFTRKRERDVLAPIVMVITLAATILLGALASGLTLLPASWILIWSQLGSVLLDRAKAVFDQAGRQQVLTAVMLLGAVGLVAIWLVMRFELATANPALIWYAVAGLLWSRQRIEALLLPILVAVAYGLTIWLGIATTPTEAAILLFSVVFAISSMARPTWSATLWTLRQSGAAGLYTLYGLGQGLLIVALLQDGPANAQLLVGTALLAAIIVSSSGLLTILLNRVTRKMWSEARTASFAKRARKRLLSYFGVYCLPILFGLAYWAVAGDQPWLYHWFAFATLGLVLALAVTFHSLGNALVPGVAFLIAGVIALLAPVPFLLVTGVLAVVQLLLLLSWSERVEQYAFHLI